MRGLSEGSSGASESVDAIVEALNAAALELTDFEKIQTAQKHPGRKKFVRELVTHLRNYIDEKAKTNRRLARPEAFWQKLQATFSSRRDLLVRAIQACQKNDAKLFADTINTAQELALQSLGKEKGKDGRAPYQGDPGLHQILLRLGHVSSSLGRVTYGVDITDEASEKRRKRKGFNSDRP